MYNVNIFIRTKYPSLVLSLKQKGSQCIWYKLRNFGNIKVRGILHMLETFGSCQFGQLVSTWVPTCVLVVVTDVKFKIYIVNVMLCIKRKVIVVSRLGRMNLTQRRHAKAGWGPKPPLLATVGKGGAYELNISLGSVEKTHQLWGTEGVGER